MFDVDDDMSFLIGQHWKKPPPGKVIRWESDGQGGGAILHLTPEEAAKFDADQEAEAVSIDYIGPTTSQEFEREWDDDGGPRGDS